MTKSIAKVSLYKTAAVVTQHSWGFGSLEWRESQGVRLVSAARGAREVRALLWGLNQESLELGDLPVGGQGGIRQRGINSRWNPARPFMNTYIQNINLLALMGQSWTLALFLL